MKHNYPDYNTISEVKRELEEALRYDEVERYSKLQKKLRELLVEGGIAERKTCKDKSCRSSGHVYYPGKVHHLDGDTNNESFGNLAMVCPECQAHILLSRYSPQDIWLLKARDLSNAEVGRLLGISRERVRQLCKKYEAKHEAELTALLEANINDLVKKAEYLENHLIASGRLKRRIDKRTKKKRIIAELDRQKEAQHER